MAIDTPPAPPYGPGAAAPRAELAGPPRKPRKRRRREQSAAAKGAAAVGYAFGVVIVTLGTLALLLLLAPFALGSMMSCGGG